MSKTSNFSSIFFHAKGTFDRALGAYTLPTGIEHELPATENGVPASPQSLPAQVDEEMAELEKENSPSVEFPLQLFTAILDPFEFLLHK
jgi:hypothetical protein